MASYNERYFNSQDPSTWSPYEARLSRCALCRALYASTTYSDIHSYAHTLKWAHGLYRGVRSLGSPTYLIANTYKDNIWPGVLDQDAEDIGAIPIYTEIPSLRPFIADIWKWSQWSRKKNLLVLTGTVCGDVGLEVLDTIDRVYLKIIKPENVKEVELDDFGNVKTYTLEYGRSHPEHEKQNVTYTKVVSKNGDTIKFETFLNGDAYAWPENVDYAGSAKATWTENYGFIPFVWFRHIDNGTWYGESEFLAGLSRFLEIDDLASQLGDWIRKHTEPVWIAEGLVPANITDPITEETDDRPRPEGEEINLQYTGEGTVKPLVAPLNIEHTDIHIDKMIEGLERVYPEITISKMRLREEAMSGRAIRIARQPVEVRIRERRIGYDSGLTAALKMTLSIGGYRGIYPGITLDSYAQGGLEFEISDRDVFITDEMDKVEIDQKFFEAMKTATDAGISPRGFLKSQNWTDEQVATLMEGSKDLTKVSNVTNLQE